MPKSAQRADLSRADRRPSFAATRGAIWLAAVCLVGLVLTAYRNSFSGPFVFDDGAAILGNPSIRRLSAVGEVLSPPREGGQTVGGRPMVNLSLAVNHALGGGNVRGYHILNFVIHALAALTLFGVVRRTLLGPVLRDRFGAAATPLALAVAALWAVHPLVTESVTYVIQRAESLMGLFYLLTLYCFIRGVSGANAPAAAPENRKFNGWLLVAVVTCVLGMATKEVMASAPLLVLLYDRTFVAGSWRAAWAKRRIFHLGLALSWLLLGWLVLSADNRGGTAGLGLGDSVWTYALTQTRAITLYLKLALWPRPLVFDYGTESIEQFRDALPYVVAVAGLLAGAAVSLWRRPVLGFLGAWFFVILAPSSSVVPIPVQPMAEHRMYLPLAAVVSLVVLGVHAQWRRAGWFAFAAIGGVFIVLTAARNDDFRSATSIWADTVAKRPANARAQCYLGDALAAEGRLEEALAHYGEAIRLDRPADARGARSIYCDILVNSGNVLRALGRRDEAVKRYEEALRIDGTLVAAHFNLGAVHLQENRLPAAVDQFEQALKIDANYGAAHASLGSALLLTGRTAEALVHYETALRLDPSARAYYNLGVALLYVRRLPEAIARLEQAVQLQPEFAQAHEFLANALAAQGRKAEAIDHYRRALQFAPGNERVRSALESLAASSRR